MKKTPYGEMSKANALKFLPILKKKIEDGTVGRILTAKTDSGEWFNVELLKDSPVQKAQRAEKRISSRNPQREEMRKKILPLIVFDKKTRKPLPKQARVIAQKTGFPYTSVAAFIAWMTMGKYKRT